MEATKVKICGIRDTSMALYCADQGADFIGLNFSPASSRKLDLAAAVGITTEFRKRQLHSTAIVFLFYKNTAAEIANIIETVPPDFIQYITDDMNESDFDFTSLPLIPAIRVKDNLTDLDLADYHSGLFILDSWSANAGGGTGHSFNWENIAGITKKFLLAGGLNPDNVQRAVETVRPYGVDVASGVESSPGIKDRELIKQFIYNAKRR